MRLAATLIAALALTACGSHTPRTPEQVARAWSAALDRADNEAAAKLFAAGATIVQNDSLTLATHRDAVAWNAALPCGGRITRVLPHGASSVIVVFQLTERPGHTCDAPGQDAAALFKVAHGKIVLWFQTAPPPAAPSGPTI
ncbi:MAG TPA: hypothetical protein VI408_12070 [Gaiellaceae bacterium]